MKASGPMTEGRAGPVRISVRGMRAANSVNILLCLAALLLSGVSAPAAAPPADSRLAIAVTQPTERPPVTALYLLDPQSGAATESYRDPKAGLRLLVKMAGSDLLGAAEALLPSDIYALLGPAAADPGALDSLSLLRVPGPGGQVSWKRVADLPLCFSEASPYGMWNRAPLLAVSPDRSRIAITAVRIGEKVLAGPTIRVLSMYNDQEWQLPLPGKDFRAVDLAWSADGTQLAYAVLPLGDEHTLDASRLPEAGVYLADIQNRTVRLFHHCYPAAVAWAPKGDRLSIAVQADVWSGAGIIRSVSLTNGKRTEEFSVAGAAQALAYSPDGRWLAIQVAETGSQTVQLRATSDGWARAIYRLPAGDGRLVLLGWVRPPRAAGAAATPGSGHD